MVSLLTGKMQQLVSCPIPCIMVPVFLRELEPGNVQKVEAPEIASVMMKKGTCPQTIKRLRLAQRRILRIKRERNSMLNEDTNSYRRRAIENAATSVINSGFDAAWQKRGSLLTRESTLSAAMNNVRKDEWLDINTATNDAIVDNFTAISNTVSLTLGVLDCTPKQAERLSLRQGNSHIYPEDFLAQMLNDTLN